jgi:hypothetical protein
LVSNDVVMFAVMQGVMVSLVIDNFLMTA